MNKRSVELAAIGDGRGSALAIPSAQVAEAARSYARASKAQATLRAYRSAWRGFVAWCEAHGFEYLPATPTTVALYATARAEAGIRPASIDLDLAAIAAAHIAAGHPSPRSSAEVQAVRSGIRRTHGTAQRQAAPLLPDDLRRIVAALPSSLAGTRDRALLLLGFATGSRRSELAALQVEDLAFVARGLEVTIRRSKTDQEGKGMVKPVPFGHPATCLVRACKAWIEAAGIKSGPLFRSIDRHGNVGATALTGHTAATPRPFTSSNQLPAGIGLRISCHRRGAFSLRGSRTRLEFVALSGPSLWGATLSAGGGSNGRCRIARGRWLVSRFTIYRSRSTGHGSLTWAPCQAPILGGLMMRAAAWLSWASTKRSRLGENKDFILSDHLRNLRSVTLLVR